MQKSLFQTHLQCLLDKSLSWSRKGGKTVVDHGLVLAKGSILSQWYNPTQKFVE